MTSEDLKIVIDKVRKRKNEHLMTQLIAHGCNKIKIMHRDLFTTAILLDNRDQIVSIGNAKRTNRDKHDSMIGETVAITKALKHVDNCGRVYDLEYLLTHINLEEKCDAATS